MIEIVSIDLSNFCSKQCSFCYNHSRREGSTLWKPEEVIALATDCIRHGVKAVSLGGGEPFEYEGIFDIIGELYPQCYVSVTSNGLPLDDEHMWRLERCKPDKIHLSLHHPDSGPELARIVRQLARIESIGIKPGVNLLVSRHNLVQAQAAYEHLLEKVGREQIIIIPMRFKDTPSAKDLAHVALDKPFQSPSCLLGCKEPTDFVSISWDKKVSRCSYSHNKSAIKTFNYEGLVCALEQVKWSENSCQR